MKKFMTTLLLFALTLSLAACSSGGQGDAPDPALNRHGIERAGFDLVVNAGLEDVRRRLDIGGVRDLHQRKLKSHRSTAFSRDAANILRISFPANNFYCLWNLFQYQTSNILPRSNGEQTQKPPK